MMNLKFTHPQFFPLFGWLVLTPKLKPEKPGGDSGVLITDQQWWTVVNSNGYSRIIALRQLIIAIKHLINPNQPSQPATNQAVVELSAYPYCCRFLMVIKQPGGYPLREGNVLLWNQDHLTCRCEPRALEKTRVYQASTHFFFDG